MALEWKEDIGSGDPIEAEDFIEIRDNVEKLDDEKCSTHNSDDDEGYNGEDWDNEDGTFNSGTNETYKSGDRSGDYDGFDSGYNSGTNSSYCGTHYSDDYGSYDGADLGSHDSSDHIDYATLD